MSRPFFSRRALPLALTLAVVAGAGLFASSTSRAQVPIVPPNLQLKLAPTLNIQVSPQLKTHLLATKLKVAPAVLDKQFFLKANIPFIKLANGEEKALIPLALMEGGQSASTDKLPAEVEELRPYITDKNGIFQVRKTPFKFGKLLLLTRVDHRAQMSPIKDQGSRGTCVAHAANAALEAFPSIPNDLSEQYSYDLFMRKESRQPCDDGGLKTTNSAIYLADGTVAESAWAYSSSVPPCNTTVPASATSAPKYKITSYQMVEDGGETGAASIKNPRYLEALLRQGHNIVLGTHVAWGSPDANGVLDVVINSTTGQPAASRGGHAMLICGFDSAKNYFIVKNSWGSSWSNAGYAYLSYDYIRTYAKYGYYIKGVSPLVMMALPNVAKPQIVVPGTLRKMPNLAPK